MTAPADAELEDLRARYAADLAGGVERFFARPRRTCPWCGSGRLKRCNRAPDFVQRKPGSFTWDGCRTCGHVFQNPSITPEGLDFYYRDFYDGLGGATVETMFAAQTEFYLGRARMVGAFTTPQNWLDVGCGYGHFAKDARSILPTTRFSGLDFGAAVAEGAERGWLDTAYRGNLRDLAGELTGSHDVISLIHYLEHIPDPHVELDVVADVLDPGSYLLIEMPDPECRLGRALGPLWTPAFQVQHLHLFPMRNLLAALTERDLVPVAVERGEAHMPIDLTAAVIAVGQILGPDPDLPWRPPATDRARRTRARVWKALSPAMKAAYAADLRLAPLLRRTGTGNVYRVLARRGEHMRGSKR
ncbi:MAG: class I SAM-dependent methyltransferase [Sporichthyaceae bacterium]